MSPSSSIGKLRQSSGLLGPNALAPLEIKLIKSLQIRGLFPTSLNLLNRLQREASHELNAANLSELFEADQVLALRMISLANYEYYRPTQPITTVQAAVSHLGAKVADVVGHIAEAKNFNAIYLARAVSLTMMQQSMIAGVIARQIAKLIDANDNDVPKQAYVLSALINAVPNMMAFFKPTIFSGLCLECLDDRVLFELTFKKLFGRSIGECASAGAEALGLPPVYRSLSLRYDEAAWKIKERPRGVKQQERAIIIAVYAANLIAHEICYFTGIQGVQSLIRRLEVETDLSQNSLEDVLGTVAENYLSASSTLELKPLRLPEYLMWFAPVELTPAESPSWPSKLPGINERINPFLYELRKTLRSADDIVDFWSFTHAVYCTLNALVKGLNFDRAVFFQLQKDPLSLQLLLSFGMKLFEPEKVRRYLEDPQKDTMPDVQAFLRRKPIFHGQPVFPDGWPFVAFPVVHEDTVVGVFYADKIRRPDGDALGSQEEIACVALGEEWHDIPVRF